MKVEVLAISSSLARRGSFIAIVLVLGDFLKGRLGAEVVTGDIDDILKA